MSFEHLKVGDSVIRNLAGIYMPLTVLRVDDTVLYAGNDKVPTPSEQVTDAWCFDRKTGAEVDEELRWGPKFGGTGSFLVKREVA